jgi:hypothetical protein
MMMVAAGAGKGVCVCVCACWLAARLSRSERSCWLAAARARSWTHVQGGNRSRFGWVARSKAAAEISRLKPAAAAQYAVVARAHDASARAHDRGAAAAAARCELAACELTYDMTTTAFLVSGSVMATGRAHT